ncbi:AAA family ATPase [Hoyosella sp. G463]|uniref:AAA family ATPase n=1 Tax=Lolliginicoccus lacisalsi TaxID=2742202 RepID=A0A927JBP2_9ACTN|nr:ATP-binding domain-containing protein [Lolliginicoccus lacisalsi]MBD8506348.1 AAA family ATPase [Lolliginicoccus lacisalsi]
MLYGRLDALREQTRTRIRDVLRMREENPQELSERESYNALYTDKLAKYTAAENGLCFGRIDDVDESVRYIGRIGMWDDEVDSEPLLLDWRAPLARAFYLATPASPDGVARRRHIRTRGREITALHDEILDPDAADALTGSADGSAETVSEGVAGESALLAAISAARTGHMTDIVSTIQREQDVIIRSHHRGVLVVEGGPGTGKTAVALHRVAYLLYTFREQLERSGVLIIGPNSTFLDYISQVLPSLGETGVVLSTVGDLYPGVTARTHDTDDVAAIKGSMRMVDILKTAVRDWQTVPSAPIEVPFDTYTLRVDKALATRARGRARSSRRAHNKAREIFVSTAVDLLASQYRKAISAGIDGGHDLLDRDDLADIRDELRADPAVRGVLDSLWPMLTPQQVLMELLSDPDRLRTASGELLAADEQKRILRARSALFSDTDAPLLDELAELIGIDNDDDDEAARAQWRARIAEAQDALDILTGSAPQDLEDDLDPEILMAYDLIDAETLAERQQHRQYRTTAERAAADRQWTYGHTIIDEAQELSPMAWRMVMRRTPNRWMTIVGDPAQTGSPASAGSWNDALEPYVAQRWRLQGLSVNYRTPAEIMDVASGVLAQFAPGIDAPRSIRHSGHAPVIEHVGAEELAAAAWQNLAKWRDEPGTAVILAPEDLVEQVRDASAHDDANTEVSVLSVREAKGLEFDSVLIVEPGAIAAQSTRGMSDLYVAISRATQRLAIIHHAALPAGMDQAASVR